MIVLVDGADGHELRLAVVERIQRLTDRCQPVPAILTDLAGACRRGAWAQLDAPLFATGDPTPDGGEMLLVDVREAARLLSLSESQTKRLIGNGTLPSVTVGRSRRLRRDDLIAFVAGLSSPTANRGSRTIETRSVFALAPEQRDQRSQLRAKAGARGFSGYAATFGQTAMIGVAPNGFRECIAPGAFTTSIREGDPVLLADHDLSKPLARVIAGTLRLTQDAKGLLVDADLPNTTAARDLAENIAVGNVKGMSFGFRVRPGGERWASGPDGTETRTLTDVELIEVSSTAFPAYSGTTADVRSAINAARATHPAAERHPHGPVGRPAGTPAPENVARRIRALGLLYGIAPAGSDERRRLRYTELGRELGIVST